MKKIIPVMQYANIPNLLTTLGLCFGIAACYYLSERSLKGVLICMFSASLIDLADGFLAVKLDKQTNFGKYMDTLTDFFICCVMPVLMVVTFVGNGILLMGGIGFFCVCGLWRLANYNVSMPVKQTRFIGLPVPGAMLFVSMAIWGTVRYDLAVWWCVPIFFLTGLLMVSSFKLKKYGFWQMALWAVWLAFSAVVIVSS